MPRVRRQISESGYYHVMVRGNARQIIFESDADRRFFLGLLKKSMEGTSVSVLAWCLMDTHVHLLISDPAQNLSLMMKRLLSQYARYFNALADRVGHVFQDRFLSIPVETDHYLLEAARYIHRNPVRGCLCSNPGDYEWSSYREYLVGRGIAETETVLDMLGGLREFIAYHESDGMYVPRFAKRISTEDMIALAKMITGLDDLHVIGTLTVQRRNGFLALLRSAGLSCRQIEHLTGVARGIVQDVRPNPA